jgi:hypothetical protein
MDGEGLMETVKFGWPNPAPVIGGLVKWLVRRELSYEYGKIPLEVWAIYPPDAYRSWAHNWPLTRLTQASACDLVYETVALAISTARDQGWTYLGPRLPEPRSWSES